MAIYGIDKYYWYVIYVCLAIRTQSARILLLPSQIGSHILDSHHLGVALAARGHEVYTLLGSRISKRYEVDGIKTLRFHVPEDAFIMESDEYSKQIIEWVFKTDVLTLIRETSSMGMRDCNLILNDSETMENIKKMNFDLAIYDGFLLCPCLPLIAEVADIPLRVNSVAGVIPWDFRIPALPSFVPFVGPFPMSKRGGILGLMDRFRNLIVYAIGVRVLGVTQNTSLLEKYAPNFSTYADLLRRSDLIIIHHDHLLEEVGPSMPHVLHTGSLSPKPAQKLPSDLESFMQASVEGVILLSFGSIVNMLPIGTIKKFIEALKGVRQDVIWRLSSVTEDVKSNLPPNIKVMDWLPQNDVLGHPKTRLFVTHCGNNGQYEAVYHGVPMLGIPLFAEQHKNCYRAEQKGISLTSNIIDFSPQELQRNINVLLADKTFVTKAKELSAIMKDAPLTPTQRAVHSIEHILKFGAGHLRSSAMDMPLYQFIMLDIIAVIFVILLVMSCFLISFIKRILSHCVKLKEKQS